MSGNLSHQIEHHLFPDLPSNRYAEIAPKVQALFDKYDLNYHSRPLVPQVYSAWHKVVRLSLPNGWLATTNAKNAPAAAQAALQDGDRWPQDPSRRPGPPRAAGPSHGQGRLIGRYDAPRRGDTSNPVAPASPSESGATVAWRPLPGIRQGAK